MALSIGFAAIDWQFGSPLELDAYAASFYLHLRQNSLYDRPFFPANHLCRADQRPCQLQQVPHAEERTMLA
jgi:hypothetical protein